MTELDPTVTPIPIDERLVTRTRDPIAVPVWTSMNCSSIEWAPMRTP